MSSWYAGVGVAVVGAGYWGPKLVRNLVAAADTRRVWVADLDQCRLDEIKAVFPHISTTRDYGELLANPDVDAIVLATPVATHARLGRETLLAGKHLMVEKPLSNSVETAAELVDLAASLKRVLMVGHTFVYHPAVQVLREIVHSGELGRIYYANAQRLNLGVFQRDINVMWDLAPHDISILMSVLGKQPVAVSARGSAYVRDTIEDVAYLDVRFPERVSAAIHVSWLDPNKVRRLTFVGSKKMVVYDDVESLEKIRIYDKGVDAPPHTSEFGEFQLSYRYGSITIPHVPGVEPLRVECEHFLRCVLNNETPITDGEQGLAVVRVLESAEASLRRDGEFVPVSTTVDGAGSRPTGAHQTAVLNAVPVGSQGWGAAATGD
jgi:predicted dehydrogenase